MVIAERRIDKQIGQDTAQRDILGNLSANPVVIRDSNTRNTIRSETPARSET